MQNKRKKAPWWALVLLDVLLIGAVLGVYALLILAPGKAAQAPVSIVPETTPAVAEPGAEVTPSPEAAQPETWAERFREHFTDEVVVTDTSYTSPNISITITAHQTGEKENNTMLTWYVADICIADIDCFRTYLAKGEDHGRNTTDDPMVMFEESGAILAVSGDFEAYSAGGTIVRNGLLYRDTDSGADVCALFSDGRMVCYDAGTLVLEDVLDDGLLQAWTFGPTLVKDGAVAPNLYLRDKWNAREPRVALGYFEPGHYCFVVADGRQYGYSNGASLETLAQILVDLGCESAYNLDGGGSAFMAFDGERVNQQSSNRRIGDILLITEPEGAA